MVNRILWAYVQALKNKGINMLYYAAVFLVVALIAGFLGFASLTELAATIAQILFVVFLVQFVATVFRRWSLRS